MSTVFINPNWRMPRNANQGKSTNYSLNFDGGSYISLGNSSLSLTANSISIWFKTSSTTSGQQLLSKYGSTYQFQFRLETNGTITLYSFENQSTFATLQSASGYNDGNWHNVITTFNTTDGHKMYVDGNTTPVDTDTANKSALQSSSERMLIGARDSSTGVIDTARYFNGDISFISIFDYALSASQITTLYGNSTNGPGNPMALSSPPTAYYPLGGAAGAFQTPVNNNDKWLIENNAIGDYVFDFIPNDSIDTNFTLPNYSDYSYSFWIKNTGSTSGSDQWILGNSSASVSGDTGSRGAVRINNSTKIRIFGGDDSNYYRKQYNFTAGNAQGNTNIFDGKWYNIVITFTSGTIVFYVNGVAQTHESTGTTGTPITGFAANNSYRIGQSGVNTGYLNHSELSNVQIFNTVLSRSDAETLYNYGSPIRTLANIPQNSNLKAWYKLNAGEIYNSTSTEWRIANNPYNYNTALKLWSNGWNNTPVSQTYQIENGNPRTVSAWIQIPPLATYNALFAQAGNGTSQYNCVFWGQNWGGLSLFTPVVGNNSSDRFLYFGLTPSDIIRDHWYHIAFTDTGVDGVGRFKVYLNGEFKNQSTLNYDYGTYINGFKWGGTTNDNVLANGTNLALAQCRLYDVVLTDSEIQTLYNNGTPQNINNVKPSNLKQWIAFDDQLPTASPWTLPDLSGNNNTANLSYAPLFTSILDPINTKNALSSGMSQSNLVQSDLQTVAPYSKYAIEFDHTDADYIDLTSDINLGSTMSFSVWLKTDHVNPSGIPQNTWVKNITGGDGFFNFNMLFGQGLTNGRLSNYVANTSGATGFDLSTNPLNDNIWHHCFVTFDGSTLKSYIDGSLNVTIEGITAWTSNIIKTIGRYDSANIRYFDGILSNMAVWNSALTASQAREVYNQGLPGNLNIFSGPAPVAWWQLGEGSSYAGGWIFADEIGSINGEGQNLTEINLVNGVGTTANGTSTGMGVEALVSDAPYSTGNAMSVNMGSAAKGSNTP